MSQKLPVWPFAIRLLLLLGAGWGCGEKDPTQPRGSAQSVAAAITISPAAVSLSFIGETRQLNATVRDQNGAVLAGAPVTWVSSDPSVAGVSPSGLVEAAGNGTAVISALAGLATPGNADVSVEQKAHGVSVFPDSVTLIGARDTVTLLADVRDAGGTGIENPGVSWLSTDTSVIQVNESGLVISVGVGLGFVSATSRDGGGLAAGNALLLVYDSLRIETSPPLPQGIVGNAYWEVLEASGADGVYHWRIASGALPRGLRLDSLGVIAGTPLRLERAYFTAQVTSAGQMAQLDFSMGTCDVSFGECR